MALEHEFGQLGLPPGQSTEVDLAWLRMYRLRREGKKVPVFDPDWYNHLQPVSDISALTPEMFGVIDEGGTHYGWAAYNFRLKNAEVQRRAAEGLLRFTQEPTNFGHLFAVSENVQSEIPVEGDFSFRPPMKFWSLEKALQEFMGAGDIEGAAHHTAKVLFSPWLSYKISRQDLMWAIGA